MTRPSILVLVLLAVASATAFAGECQEAYAPGPFESECSRTRLPFDTSSCQYTGESADGCIVDLRELFATATEKRTATLERPNTPSASTSRTKQRVCLLRTLLSGPGLPGPR